MMRMRVSMTRSCPPPSSGKRGERAQAVVEDASQRQCVRGQGDDLGAGPVEGEQGSLRAEHDFTKMLESVRVAG